VIGLDAAPSFVAVAQLLSHLLGWDSRTLFVAGDACHLPFADAAFHAVFSQHLTMNIPDKGLLFREWYRVLQAGGRIGLNEVILRTGEPEYPVPWARDRQMSFLVGEETLRESLLKAGFRIIHWEDWTELGLKWFAEVRGAGGSLTLKLVMGPQVGIMSRNYRRALEDGRLGLVEVVAEKLAKSA